MTDHDDPLSRPVQFLSGVGPRRAELLAKLEILTAGDLLWHLPRDVLDLSQTSAVFELTADREHAIRGEVVDRDSRWTSTGKLMTAVLFKADGGFIRAVWFNQGYMFQKLPNGQCVLLSGKPKLKERRWEFSHPRVQWLDDDDGTATPGVLPRYGLTDGLSMLEMRRMTAQAARELSDLVPDPLPESFRHQRKWPSLPEALRGLHTPQTVADFHRGWQRVIFDDLFEFQLAVALRRRYWQRDSRAEPLPVTAKIDARIRRLFPFQMTAGQDAAIREITADLARPQAMHRLLQADVGAGKTAIAVYAMLVAVANQSQTVLMAPTEVLAQQHWQTIDRLLEQSRVERRLLTGQLSTVQRAEVLDGIASGRVQLVVGTQAVIQDAVQFQRLGLVVIDEQHKFGVSQRGRFQTRGTTPHRLVMTATPIPRSLCLTQFGDLDQTVMRDQPPGRQKIATHVLPGAGAVAKAWEFIIQKLREGRQAYVVCPRIVARSGRPPEDSLGSSAGQSVPASSAAAELSEQADPGADAETDWERIAAGTASANHESRYAGHGAEAVFRELSTGLLREFRVGLMHGQQDRQERAAVMDAFREGALQVLVATTVIEVGVDVPNATLMLIYDAERFGLSQLHQLRGRVGRGRFQGYCFLQTDAEAPEARRRLAAVEASTDGFQIAESDFEFRGPGDVLGTRQHGALPLRVADLVRDRDVLDQARSEATDCVSSQQFDTPEFAPLKIRVLERFAQLMDLPQSG